MRRRAILDGAAEMLDQMPVADLSLNELSRRVCLAKSNVLRYFESREEILLELLDRGFRECADEISDRVSAIDPHLPVTERGDRLAAAFAHALRDRPILCDLIAAQPGVLERNVSPEVVLHYKRSAHAILGPLVATVRTVVPELGENAWSVCMMSALMAAALSVHSRPSPVVLAALQADPALAPLFPDPATYLETTLATLVAGTLVRSGAQL
ncbi:hypothetical protein NRB20_62690 [Nocardia sp. RB20]|uniref:HTH tetR-type domain-containing protein n=1 Tax=Nocardia macrotermitis TaxID=2585198 RepID=A0A7K0DCT7_9NOCA|nr:hypothetical protein [Nocardia macrotermitis]